jgi:hypothetical protein
LPALVHCPSFAYGSAVLPAQTAPSGHAAHWNGALALGAQKPGLHWQALFAAAVSVPM